MDLLTSEKITWCPGCGNHSIFAALKSAIQSAVEMPGGPSLDDFTVCYGIGCHGHMVNYLKTYGFQGLHGRPIPLAEGIKLANPRLKLIVVTGDGDCFGEGLAHFINACRRNIDINIFVHDNRVFGLTVGQTSPTAQKGYISKSTPTGAIEEPINGLALALSSSATFVAQELAFDIPNLTKTMTAAIAHQGISYLNILQQCISFNKINTVDWYRHNSQKVDGRLTSRLEAQKAVLAAKKLPVGIIFQEKKPTYSDQIVKEKLVEFDRLKNHFV